MRVSLVQTTSGTDPAQNTARLRDLVPDGSDLVVLPEAFACDFGSTDTELADRAQPLDGPFGRELERVAAQRDTTVLAGMFETAEDPARPYNTLVMRGRARAEYRKIHLYDSFGYRESDRLSPGPLTPVTVGFGDLRIGLLTCYDLRFPELSRRLVEAGADVLVAPAAWVAGPRKVEHWRTLVRARAIENTAYVVAVGQSGPRYTGHSMAVSPDGDVLAEAGLADEVLNVELDSAVVAQARGTNPSLRNRRL